MGRLTTHVLDTATGNPAAGVPVELWWVPQTDEQPALIAKTVTNEDGRTDDPLLDQETYRRGVFELRFFVGTYLKDTSKTLPAPLFLDVIPIRFGIAEANGNYHVPLLLSPFGYSTYRGS